MSTAKRQNIAPRISLASGGGGQLVTNVVIGEDSGFQILSSKDEEAEREKPRKVISTKVHKKKIKAIHDHRKDDLSQSLEKAKKLLDVKAAIEKLRLRSIESEDGTGKVIYTKYYKHWSLKGSCPAPCHLDN